MQIARTVEGAGRRGRAAPGRGARAGELHQSAEQHQPAGRRMTPRALSPASPPGHRRERRLRPLRIDAHEPHRPLLKSFTVRADPSLGPSHHAPVERGRWATGAAHVGRVERRHLARVLGPEVAL